MTVLVMCKCVNKKYISFNELKFISLTMLPSKTYLRPVEFQRLIPCFAKSMKSTNCKYTHGHQSHPNMNWLSNMYVINLLWQLFKSHPPLKLKVLPPHYIHWSIHCKMLRSGSVWCSKRDCDNILQWLIIKVTDRRYDLLLMYAYQRNRNHKATWKTYFAFACTKASLYIYKYHSLSYFTTDIQFCSFFPNISQ